MNKFIMALLVLSMTSCAYQSAGDYERPDGRVFRTARQPRMASASHWQKVADNEAKQLLQTLAGQSVLIEQSANSNFADTYRKFLTSSLVSGGAAVVTAAKPDSVKVTYDVNIVNHERGDKSSYLADQNKGLGLHKVVYYVLSEVVGVVKAPPAVFAEQLGKNLSTVTEVVVTTQASFHDELLYSGSNVYYIDGANQSEYVGKSEVVIPVARTVPTHRAGNAVSMKVVGGH